MNEKMTTNYYKVLEILYDSLVTINSEKVAVITQVEISKKMNLSTITINAIFKELKNDGLIVSYGTVGRYKLSNEAIRTIENTKRI